MTFDKKLYYSTLYKIDQLAFFEKKLNEFHDEASA